jgi:hypothetical protein
MERLTRQDFKKLKDIPGERIEVDLDTQFTKDEFEKIKLGFRSHKMDQRWNILYEDNLLYMHRSWTGHCIFVGTIESKEDGTGHLKHLTINGDSAQYQRVDTNEDIETMLTIVGSHLIERAKDK